VAVLVVAAQIAAAKAWPPVFDKADREMPAKRIFETVLPRSRAQGKPAPGLIRTLVIGEGYWRGLLAGERDDAKSALRG